MKRDFGNRERWLEGDIGGSIWVRVVVTNARNLHHLGFSHKLEDFLYFAVFSEIF